MDDARLKVPPDYHPLDGESLPRYLAMIDSAHSVLGGEPDAWTVEEVGDGNLNLVFIVRGPTGGLVVKQALPYLRLVGDRWPLPLKRAFFECEALIEEARHAGKLVPQVYHFDPTLALIVMEYLTPHIILRKGLIRGIRYPRLASDMAEFMAQTLFKTSDLYLPACKKKQAMAIFCDNIELCKITEDLIFTDPYRIAKANRWTTPQLDEVASEFRNDAELKWAAQGFKEKFLSHAEALIHGDLHSGSVMVTETDTRVIDPEFAFFGPMGFDTGAFIGNLLLAFFSQEGHATEADSRDDYRAWILDQMEAVWNGFERRFLELWSEYGEGDVYLPSLFSKATEADVLQQGKKAYLARLFRDTLGFGGMKMIRRILGLAHVADLEAIKDPDLRARCESKALKMGRDLVVNHASYKNIKQVREKALEIFKE